MASREAQNYAVDLTHGLERRESMADFATGFRRRMRRNIPLLKAAKGRARPTASGPSEGTAWR